MKVLENIHIALSIVIGIGLLVNIYSFIKGSLKLNKISRQKIAFL